jgi:hypothetical protein
MLRFDGVLVLIVSRRFRKVYKSLDVCELQFYSLGTAYVSMDVGSRSQRIASLLDASAG